MNPWNPLKLPQSMYYAMPLMHSLKVMEAKYQQEFLRVGLALLPCIVIPFTSVLLLLMTSPIRCFMSGTGQNSILAMFS